MNFCYNCQKGFIVVEVPIYFLFMISIASISIGIGVGYRLASPPTVTKSNTYCDFFANDNSHQWNKSLAMERTFTNGKCTSISCPVFDDKTKHCSIINARCKYLG